MRFSWGFAYPPVTDPDPAFDAYRLFWPGFGNRLGLIDATVKVIEGGTEVVYHARPTGMDV